jgi:hypothetical protein
MGDSDKQLATDALRILHGARSLSPLEAAEAPRHFLEAMPIEDSGDKLADASMAAVTELVRSLKVNHAASDDLWQDANDPTLSFANEAHKTSAGDSGPRSHYLSFCNSCREMPAALYNCDPTPPMSLAHLNHVALPSPGSKHLESRGVRHDRHLGILRALPERSVPDRI